MKGGEHVGVDMVHKLKSVVEREKALLGILVTLNPPSAQAEKEAVAAGYEEVDMGTGSARFRKIQIPPTIEQLMTGTRANLPIVNSTAFRKARRESEATQNEMDLVMVPPPGGEGGEAARPSRGGRQFGPALTSPHPVALDQKVREFFRAA